jgi:cytosine deaminase
MDALENAGRVGSKVLRNATMYTTLSPCDMCSGAILLYGIPKVVVGEHQTFRGPEAYLRQRKVDVEVLDRLDCVTLMRDFVRARPDLWFEDIGRG